MLERAEAGWPQLGPVLRLACATYVTWMAVRLWRCGREAGTPASITFASVFMATLLNPKALLFAVAVFPAVTFASVSGYLATTGQFAATLVPIAAIWVGLGASAARSFGGLGPGLIPRAAAVVLLLFSASLGASVLI